MKQIRNNIQVVLAIISFAASIIGIFVITRKIDIPFKIEPIFIGIFGAACGILLSIAFARLTRKKNTTKVFISYAFSDKNIAEKISQSLGAKHISVINETEDLEIGVDLQKQVKESLKDIDIVIVLISKEYYKNRNLKSVIELSKSMNKKILPITTDNSELPKNISNLIHIDTSENIDEATNEIVEKVLHTQ